jgi:ureidoacrylate peracid hydrolase
MLENKDVNSMKLLDPKKTALLVIDCQNDFCHPDGVSGKGGIPLQNIHEAMPRLHRLIRDVKSTAVRTIYVRYEHNRWADSPVWEARALRKKGEICEPGTWGADFFEVEPEPGDMIVTKGRYSAFINTNIDQILRCRGVQNLLFTGFITNVCVESTLRDAFMLDYYTVLVSDCCAAPTMEQHEASVSNVLNYFGTVATSEQVITMLSEATEKS